MGLREAVGALKDSTTVKIAKVNSDFKDLDIAIVKATNHIEAPPKERHVRKIFAATSVVRPRADVAYCIHALAKRLAKTNNWIVAIKVLIIFHRTLREGNPTFRELLMHYSRKGHILHLASFKDDSGRHAWDCSAWVCEYALYLEERIACFRVLKFDIESEHLTRSSSDASKVHSKTRLLSAKELLEQLPALQQLLFRLICCEPKGLACTNYLVQYSLTLVLKESFKVYCAINDGIINLVDVYFGMVRHDAIKALGIYKRAGLQAESLADFYDFCKHLALARNFQFPALRQPPPSFLATMEEYVKEAPQTGSEKKQLDHPVRDDKEETAREGKYQLDLEEEEEAKNEQKEPASLIECEPPPLISADDLLGLNDFDLKAAEIEESNARTVAIASKGNDPQISNTGFCDVGGTGWEVALVTAPGDNTGPATKNNLGGGFNFNKPLLDSLYQEDAARRQTQMQLQQQQQQTQMQMQMQMQNAGYGYGMTMQNSFGQQQGPLVLSYGIAPPTNVQMATLSLQPQMFQQQQMFQQPFQQYPFQQLPQNTNMMYYQSPSQYPQHQTLGMNPSNPFADPSNMTPQRANLGIPTATTTTQSALNHDQSTLM